MNLVFIKLMCEVAHTGQIESHPTLAYDEAFDLAVKRNYIEAFVVDVGVSAEGVEYRLTPKGNAYVEALKAVKEPIPSWSVPQ